MSGQVPAAPDSIHAPVTQVPRLLRHNFVDYRYVQNFNALPVTAHVGDTAVIGGILHVFDNGGWVVATAGRPHPTIKNNEKEKKKAPKVVLGGDGTWIASRTLALRATRAASHLAQSTPIFLANAWAEDAHQRSLLPPLCFYPPATSITISRILAHLASISIPIPTIPRLPLIHDGPAPSTALVLADLDSLGAAIVPYAELLSSYSNKDLPAHVLRAQMAASELVAPWVHGTKIIALFDVVATEDGILSSRVSLSQIVPGATFSDFAFAFGDGLGDIFPRLKSTALAKMGSKSFHSSCWCPRGYYTDIHADRSSLSQLVLHHSGEKIWLRP
ncbi:hypothetical protein MKEN_00405000 [Mycena kentingensis (nom. inval.)]|nr:hypothetical protein MKEN_00405000 [Mycena kentingensis (nom. inval.)]